MKNHHEIAKKFLKKELASIEKSFIQFKQIYEYFQTEGSNPENKKSFIESDNEKTKYIFIRLYDPIYKDNLPAELLKKGQYITNVTKISAAHAAIGFDLTDNFYGLTIGGDYDLKIEQCCTPETCQYMATCDAERSNQHTFAIKVTEKEYEAAKEMTLHYYESKEVKYAIFHNFPVALYCIRKKINLPDLPELKLPSAYREFHANLKKTLRALKQQKEKDRFVCSTFCCYILISCVPRIAMYFCEHDMNYDYITPSELSMLPDMKLLYSGKWLNFKKDAKEFASKNKEFEEYL